MAKYIFQLDLRVCEAADGTSEAQFAQVLACLVKDAYSDAPQNEAAEWHAGGGGWRRKSQRWEHVLPDSESKLGQRVMSLLETHQIETQVGDEEGRDRLGRRAAQLIIVRGFAQRLEAARRRLEGKRMHDPLSA